MSTENRHSPQRRGFRRATCDAAPALAPSAGPIASPLRADRAARIHVAHVRARVMKMRPERKQHLRTFAPARRSSPRLRRRSKVIVRGYASGCSCTSRRERPQLRGARLTRRPAPSWRRPRHAMIRPSLVAGQMMCAGYEFAMKLRSRIGHGRLEDADDGARRAPVLTVFPMRTTRCPARWSRALGQPARRQLAARLRRARAASSTGSSHDVEYVRPDSGPTTRARPGRRP